MKFKITKDGITFSKGKGELTIPIEPSHRVCEICNDDGKCKNNINHPNYNYEMNDIYDCADYVEPNWMVNWIKRLRKKWNEDYVSDFVKWSSSHSSPKNSNSNSNS